jgi:predicted phosphodiesterase
MKRTFIIVFALIVNLMNIHYKSEAQVKIGVFADCQYCNYETAGSRFYRNSLSKLENCINEFNQIEDIEFVVGLGDLIDRDFTSFDKVNTILSKSKKPVFQVIGNHDLEVEKEDLDKVPSKLNLAETWYSFTKNDWHFIFLNGNDITFHSNNPEIVQQAAEITDKLKKEGKPNLHTWNGGIGQNQLKWLKNELQNSKTKNLKVAVFCHYPLLPFEAHALWNSEEVLTILTQYNGVKLYLNGHNHAGNYVFQNGIHFVNLKGMVETEKENAFSVINFTDKQIEIVGFGREGSRILTIK